MKKIFLAAFLRGKMLAKEMMNDTKRGIKTVGEAETYLGYVRRPSILEHIGCLTRLKE